MEEHKTVIGALLFILMVVGANFVMYGIVRGATNFRGKRKTFVEHVSSWTRATQKKEDDMDELRRKLEELKQEKKE
jgi:hypothetical protein